MKNKYRILILVPLGLLLLIPALWLFVSLTAKPLHPTPESVPAVMSATPLPKWEDAVLQARKSVRAGVAGQNLPGLSVAVGIDGESVWAEGFGFADLKSSELVTPDHPFRIGTASIALTSTAAGLLLEDGRLNLDDEIQKYVPAFPKKQWPLKLRDLMGHTAGITPDGGDEGPLFTQHCSRPMEALRYFAGNSLLFQPGTQYRYSSYGWILVSSAVETAANQPFLTLMQKQVFDPLGMRNTYADAAAAEAGEDFPLGNMIRELIHDPDASRDPAHRSAAKPPQDRVTSYFPRFAADPHYGLHLMRPLDYSCYAGSSVFLSTPSDLVRFAMAIQAGKLLKPATVATLQTSQRLASGTETGYGLGWDLETVTLAGKRTRMIGHDGDSLGGTVASLMTFPDYGIVVAVTSNISYANTAAIGLKIAEAFVDQRKAPARN
jgi:CubicO group peptidase (beta-lactamase class C family)